LVTIRLANQNSGQKVLDRESRSSYVYRVVASDNGFQSATMTLSITISDINDNDPFFLNTPYFFSVNENANSQVVGTVSVSSLHKTENF